MIDSTDATFAQDVLDSVVPVIVEFTAPWCHPCRVIEPYLEELERRHGGLLRVVRIDIDANLGAPGRYGVLSLPTVIVFVDGAPRDTVHGLQPRRRYEEVAERALAGTAS